MTDLELLIKFVEKYTLPTKIEKKPIKDSKGRIVGHETERKEYLPDALKRTHKLVSYKKPQDDQNEKTGRLVVRMGTKARAEEKKRREKSTIAPEKNTYYDDK